MEAKHSPNLFSQPPNRREAIKRIGAAGLGLAGLLSSLDSISWATSEPRPNFVFILSDDHRWDHFGAAGHPFIHTPYMDRLAREGIYFQNAFVTTSLCSPSRASFLTGTYAHTHGVKNNLTPWRDENVTVLEILKQAGYATAFVGKWHMPGRLPQLRGVDFFITFTVQDGQGRYFDCPLIVNGREESSRKPYITEELTDRALEFIEKNQAQPFCLYLAHKAVHHQFLAPPNLKGLYEDIDWKYPPEMDPHVTSYAKNMLYGMLGPIAFNHRKYCQTITALDREIGRLLSRLDDLNLARNTIVVYTSDNGIFWGEHNLVDKRFAYEEAIRIPLILRGPGIIPDPGRNAEQMVLNVDLAPTFLDLAGLPIPRHMEGITLAPILKNAGTPGRAAWLYEYFRDYPYQVPQHMAVRTKTHKLIEYERKQAPELYDLTKDPQEKNNLIGTPEGDQLLPRLRAILRELQTNPRPRP